MGTKQANLMLALAPCGRQYQYQTSYLCDTRHKYGLWLFYETMTMMMTVAFIIKFTEGIDFYLIE